MSLFSILTSILSAPPLVLATLLTPLAAYHKVFQHLGIKLETVLQRLDFSVRGYMMLKPIDNQCKL